MNEKKKNTPKVLGGGDPDLNGTTTIKNTYFFVCFYMNEVPIFCKVIFFYMYRKAWTRIAKVFFYRIHRIIII